jgi:hypothetical protein
MSLIETSIHAQSCTVWDVANEALPDALLSAGFRDDRVIEYLAAARPLYDAMTRCLGQAAGLLLLVQTRGLDAQRGETVYDALRNSLGESVERLRAIAAPEPARAHMAAFEALVARLEDCARRLGAYRSLIDPAGADLDGVMSSLFVVQQGLLALAIPRAGLVPLDFRGACCNCRPRKLTSP